MSKDLHIVKHNYRIDAAMREALNGHGGLVLWFTGLSGSGKSTLANEVEVYLHNSGVHTYLLDGDNVRHGLNADLDFSIEGRKENIRRIGEVSKLMVDAGLVVLTAFVSPLKEDRELVRQLVGDRFIEIFVNCPLEVCEQRDVKGLYAKARAGIIPDFTGISSPFESPEHPELEVKTDQLTLEESIAQVVTYLKENNHTPKN